MMKIKFVLIVSLCLVPFSGAQSISDEFAEIQHPIDEGNAETGFIPLQHESTGEVPDTNGANDPKPANPLNQLPHHQMKQDATGQFEDPPNCDRKSVSSVVDYSDRKKVILKHFINCTLIRGEQATITNFILNRELLDINCTNSANDTVETTDLMFGKTFIIDAYLNPNLGSDPGWDCTLKRYGTGETITFRVFGNFQNKESFDYEVTTNGLYDMNPRLALRWAHFPAL